LSTTVLFDSYFPIWILVFSAKKSEKLADVGYPPGRNVTWNKTSLHGISEFFEERCTVSKFIFE
jgi:hypothetical protein